MYKIIRAQMHAILFDIMRISIIDVNELVHVNTIDPIKYVFTSMNLSTNTI